MRVSEARVPVSDKVKELPRNCDESVSKGETVLVGHHADGVGRAIRIEVPGGTYHVTSRGNNKEPIVRDDIDRRIFLEMLSQTTIRHSWTLLSYCLMTNHYHLIVRLDRRGLSSGMQRLNTAFARTMNVRHGRIGHLFQNRFYARLIETEPHLLVAVRYVAQNPVDAGICGAASDWRWSSHRALEGSELPLRGLAVGEVLGLFDRLPGQARVAYRDFVSTGPVSVSDTVTEV